MAQGTERARDRAVTASTGQPAAGVVVVTGVMAAGKSTVADLLAQSFPRAAHVRGDVYRRSVVSGRAEPTMPMTTAALDQLRLRYRLAMTCADLYADAGFVAVVQDIIIGPILADALALVRTRPVRLVVLDPAPAVVARREAERPKTGYGETWAVTDLVEEHRRTTPRLGLWLDTSDQTPAETVRAIRARFDEALVEDLRG